MYHWYVSSGVIMKNNAKKPVPTSKANVITAKVFWTGRSQAVRLPKEFRLDADTVTVRREGNAIILEAADDWPDGYVESFAGVPEDFARPDQGQVDVRAKL
jgi:antitoxin VapB